MITKELLKAEIDKLPEEHLGAVYRVVKTLNPEPVSRPTLGAPKPPLELTAFRWPAWSADATFRREDIYDDDGR